MQNINKTVDSIRCSSHSKDPCPLLVKIPTAPVVINKSGHLLCTRPYKNYT